MPKTPFGTYSLQTTENPAEVSNSRVFQHGDLVWNRKQEILVLSLLQTRVKKGGSTNSYLAPKAQATTNKPAEFFDPLGA